MKCEVQVHFENAGQIQWTDEIANVEGWITEMLSRNIGIAYDKDSLRHYGFDMKRVTAIVVTDKSNEQPDIWSRTYAPIERKIEENYKHEHQGNDGKRPPTTPSGRCCA